MPSRSSKQKRTFFSRHADKLGWITAAIALLAIVPNYKGFWGCKKEPVLPGQYVTVNMDSLNAGKNIVVIGDNNNLITDNRTIITNTTNYYIASRENNAGPAAPAKLINLQFLGDKLTPLVFNGATVLSVCTPGSAIIGFTNLSGNPQAAVATYSISWNESPDSTFTGWGKAVVINHRFEPGNTRMRVKLKLPGGYEELFYQNIYVGSNPVSNLFATAVNKLCFPATLNFRIGGFKSNSPGTIYRLFLNGREWAAPFLRNPLSDSVTFAHTFVSETSIPGFDKKTGSFTISLQSENPCGVASSKLIILACNKP